MLQISNVLTSKEELNSLGGKMSTTSNHNVNDEVPIFMNDDSDLKVRESHKTKIALVYGTIPSIEEIEQYAVFSSL